MVRALTDLIGGHDWRLVVLGGLVCVLASVVAIVRLRRRRARSGQAQATWLTEAPTEAIAICENGAIVAVNSSFEKLVGSSARRLRGRPLQDLLQGGAPDVPIGFAPIEIKVRSPDGPIECAASARRTRHRGRVRTIVAFSDLREQRRAELRMRHLARHDVLTDLPNRASFNERLALAIGESAATNGSFAVVGIDLDRFREINDVFGYPVGDAVLREMSRRLLATAEGAFIARIGGDEFTLITRDGAQPATAEAVADRVEAAIAEDFVIDGHRLTVGLSVGIAIYPTDGADATSLLVNADAAMYRAKSDGRGSIRFFATDADKRARERRALHREPRPSAARERRGVAELAAAG